LTAPASLYDARSPDVDSYLETFFPKPRPLRPPPLETYARPSRFQFFFAPPRCPRALNRASTILKKPSTEARGVRAELGHGFCIRFTAAVDYGVTLAGKAVTVDMETTRQAVTVRAPFRPELEEKYSGGLPASRGRVVKDGFPSSNGWRNK